MPGADSRRTRWVLLAAFAVLLVLVLAPRAPHGTPFTPSPGDVLEKASPVGRTTQAIDVDDAVRQAHELIAQSRRLGGDPRLLGRAQAVLGKWWAKDDVPSAVRLLRATIRQSFHEFEAALVDLDAVVAADPRDAQAWLTRATVLQVLARYDEAAASCEKLQGLAPVLVATVCRVQVDGLRGHAAGARDELAKAIDAGGPEERVWALSVLGDLTLWAGDTVGALARYEQVLALDPADEYTRGAAADVLLDVGRPTEAIALLEGHTQIDGQLLRLAIAQRRAKHPQAAASLEAITERVEAGRARQDVVHRREEARFTLELEENPERALELAEANWKVQREPADARVLLETALAAKQPERAQPVLEWLRSSGFEDPTLRALAKRVAP